MRRFVGIFSVSVIAIMAACNVFAATSDDVADSNIASVGYVKGAIKDLDVTDTAVTGQVVTEVSQTDGKIAVSRGTVSYNNLTDKPALKTVATTGSYNDLTNKPTIPAAQVQPDWNATTGMGAIKNKPTLGSLAAKSSVTNADIADGANIAAAKIATTKAGTGYDNMGEEAKKTAVPTVELTENIADTAAGTAVTSALKNYQPKATANYQMGNSEGKWTTMSANQQNALNSGITSGKVSTYDGYATGKQNTLTAGSNITISGNTISAKDTVTTATKSGTGNVVTGVTATNGALTVSHGITAEETKNKTTTIAAAASASDTKYPTEKAVRTALDTKADTSAIPTVNNATLTIKQGGVSKGTFTANQATAATIELTDKDTTYTVGTPTYSGTTKLYTGTGTNTDGTMTQNAITTELGNKVAKEQGTVAANKAVITNASGSITTGQVATGMIADNAVTSAKIASDAVTSAKIKDATITNADIAAAAAIAPTKVAATKAGTEYDNMGETAKETAIPTVQLAENIADTAAGTAVSSALKNLTASGSNGVTASITGTAVKVAGVTATRDAVGVAKLGVIPVGTTGTATASIWVE